MYAHFMPYYISRFFFIVFLLGINYIVLKYEHRVSKRGEQY